jgi:hypothetical protein
MAYSEQGLHRPAGHSVGQAESIVPPTRVSLGWRGRVTSEAMKPTAAGRMSVSATRQGMARVWTGSGAGSGVLTTLQFVTGQLSQ